MPRWANVMLSVATGIVIAGATVLTAIAPQAQAAQMETAVLGNRQISFLPHEFLTREEADTLRMVLTNEQALALFVTDAKGHAALAVAPEEGFIRKGQIVPSAIALAGLPDAASAESAARRACDEKRRSESPCVLVLLVSPKS